MLLHIVFVGNQLHTAKMLCADARAICAMLSAGNCVRLSAGNCAVWLGVVIIGSDDA